MESKISDLFDRAARLDALGHADEAKQAYLEILARDPAHFGTLNNLGTLLYTTGYRRAAGVAFALAIAHHPGHPVSYVNMGNALLDQNELAQARTHFEAALRIDAEHPGANHGLAILLLRAGDAEAARRHWAIGARRRPVAMAPYYGEATPIEMVLFVSALGGNIDTDRLIDKHAFSIATVIAEFFDPRDPLPAHAIIFNAVSDAHKCALGLASVAAACERTSAPVINHPRVIAGTGRVEVAERLGRLDGVITAATARFAREDLSAPSAACILARAGFAFPLLLRSPGYHMGMNFSRVERPEDLAGALHALPGDELFVMNFLDARGADGKIRKYRAMIVDRRLYPLHAAISTHWNVHYFTADMADRPEHRAEDAAFLADMEGALGARTVAALERIANELQLDYGGIDFSVDARGNVLLFEANATMVVLPPDDDPRWEYRRAPVQRILDAVRAMLVARARGEAAGR